MRVVPARVKTRSFGLGIIAVAVVIAVLATSAGSASAARSSRTAPATNATAQPPEQWHDATRQTCDPTQIDLNHAGRRTIGAELGLVDAFAKRLIAARPFLRLQEVRPYLISNPGAYERLTRAGRLCVTPATLPPPSPNPCTGKAKVDLNDPNGFRAIAKYFGGRSARRIIAAQPHLKVDNLWHLGAGIGGLALAHRKHLCATPSPIATQDGTRYGYAYSKVGGEIRNGGFRLSVPASVIDERVGAWLRITPDTSVDWPAADFHVEGKWESPGQSVSVTVPAPHNHAHFESSYYVPYLIHWDGPGRTGGEPVEATVDPRTAAVSAKLSHLSPVDWATRGINWVVEPAFGALFGNRFAAPACPREPWTHEGGTRWSRDGAYAEIDGALLDSPGSPVPPAGFLIKHCLQTGTSSNAHGRSVQARLRNTSGTIQRLAHYQNAATIGGSDEFSADLITLALTRVNRGGAVFLGPGDTGTADVPAGDWGVVSMQPDRLRSLLNVGLHKTLDKVFEKLGGANGAIIKDPTARELFVRVVGCTYDGVVAATSSGSFAQIARDVALALFDCINENDVIISITAIIQNLVNAGVLSGAQADTFLKGLLDLRELVKYLEIGQIVVDVADSLIWGSLGTVPLSIDHYARRPETDHRGRKVVSQCVTRKEGALRYTVDANCQDNYYQRVTAPPSGGGSTGLPRGIIVRDASGQAWLWDADSSVRKPIVDGRTYLCLAKHYAVDWDADPATYSRSAGPAASCDGQKPATIRVEPGALPATVGVLRQADGTSWAINGDHRFHIPSGAEFLCWVNPKYRTNMEFHVFDQVSATDVARFPVGDGQISNCGDPENPTF